ncbi:Unknown protein, partial [Striga hermonthica]
RLERPSTMREAMEIARRRDDHLVATRKARRGEANPTEPSRTMSSAPVDNRGVNGENSGNYRPSPPEVKKAPVEDFGGDNVDYWPFFRTGEIFDSLKKAINYAVGMTTICGFELIISKHSKGGTLRILKCNRGERDRGNKISNLVNVVRRKSKTKFTGCLFEMKLKKVAGTNDSWSVCFPLDDRKGYHNHPMVLYPEVHRQFSGLSEKARQIVRDMTTAQARPAIILAAIHEKYPTDNAVRQQVYNYRSRMRSESFEGRDVTSQLMHLASWANYIVFADSDKDKHTLTRVFMSHPQSALLFQTYYWYVGIDSTYKTN